MAAIVANVRGLIGAGTAEYTLGTANFWDDDQIQLVLDRNRCDFYRAELLAQPEYSGGSVSYNAYRLNRENVEATTGGSAIFVIRDTAGALVGTALWSADYARGIVTFGSNTLGAAYYVTGSEYDVYGAAADILKTWATYLARAYDFTTDGQTFRRSQMAAGLIAQAETYQGLAWTTEVTMYRGDANVER